MMYVYCMLYMQTIRNTASYQYVAPIVVFRARDSRPIPGLNGPGEALVLLAYSHICLLWSIRNIYL